MDHLPLPDNGVLKDVIQVPFYATEPYDGEDFESYPSRHGWQISGAFSVTSITHHSRMVDEAEVGSMLQTWLFFGLLFTVTGELGDLDAFTRVDNEGRRMLTTDSLGKMVGQWSQRSINEDWSLYLDSLHRWRDKAYDCLIKARYTTLGIKATPRFAGLDNLCMSVALLGEYLMQAMKDIFIKRGLTAPTAQSWRVRGYCDCGQPLIDAMLHRGWCPNRLVALDAGAVMSVGQLWFFANMKPSRGHLSHRDCTASFCHHTTVDEDAYEIRHEPDYCEPTCALVGPPAAAIDSALKDGLIPLITMCPVDGDQTSAREISLHVKPYWKDAEFIAISHVRSDGHGNPHGNVLPICFLKHLMIALGRLPQSNKSNPVTFWMDTLCVPVEKGEMRKAAIRLLKEPYERANHVLVIDSYLETLNSSAMSVMEIVARIEVSTWSQRFWTF